MRLWHIGPWVCLLGVLLAAGCQQPASPAMAPTAPFHGTGGGIASRIVYVIDGNLPPQDFAGLKAELRRSVNKLVPQQQFTVLVYGDTVSATFPPMAMVSATVEQKQTFQKWLDTLQPVSARPDATAGATAALQCVAAFESPPVYWYFVCGRTVRPEVAATLLQIQRQHPATITVFAMPSTPEATRQVLKEPLKLKDIKYRYREITASELRPT